MKCSDIRKLDEEALFQLVAKLLDVAQDAGGKVGGQNNMSPYYYRYQQPLHGWPREVHPRRSRHGRRRAYEKAVADASARAKRLAKLSQVKLGPVTAIRETGSTSQPNAQRRSTDRQEAAGIVEVQEIPVKVELTVRFDVAAAPGANAKGGDR